MGERGTDDIQDRLWIRRFGEHILNSGGSCETSSLTIRVSSCIEHDWRSGKVRVGSQFLHKLITVHGRNEDIRDDQMGTLSARDLQCLTSILSLNNMMSGVTEQSPQKLPVGRRAINYEYGSHKIFLNSDHEE